MINVNCLLILHKVSLISMRGKYSTGHEAIEAVWLKVQFFWDVMLWRWDGGTGGGGCR